MPLTTYWAIKADNVLNRYGLDQKIYGMERLNDFDAMFAIMPGQCNVVRAIKIGKLTNGSPEDLRERLLKNIL